MASDFGCFCLFVVDMSFNPGWWLAPCQASKPDEKSTKADKKACSFRSGHGASGDQNGLEMIRGSFCQFFLLKKTWECIYLDSQGVTLLFDTFTLGFVSCFVIIPTGYCYCILLHIVA